MQRSFSYNRTDFNKDGGNSDGKLFSELIVFWEAEFHDEFYPFFANTLYANNSTMLLLKRCFLTEETEDFGSDAEYDIDTNMKIEEHSQRKTFYALGSGIKGNEDEPLFLVADETVSDETVILKYVPDNDDEIFEPEDPTGLESPIEENEIIKFEESQRSV